MLRQDLTPKHSALAIAYAVKAHYDGMALARDRAFFPLRMSKYSNSQLYGTPDKGCSKASWDKQLAGRENSILEKCTMIAGINGAW